MENLTNDANGMNGKINFLRKGIYDVLSVRKQQGEKGIQYIAEVRCWSNGVCNIENVNLLYLFNPDSNGPKMQFQPETLVNHVINITACIPQQSTSGKTYYSYNWEINVELTKRVQEEVQEFINEQNIQDYEEQLQDEWLITELNLDDYENQLADDALINEQNIQDEQDYQNDLELGSQDPDDTEEED